MVEASEVQVITPPHLAGVAYEDAVRQKARKLKEELIRQTLQDGQSFTRSVQERWANEHPGEVLTHVIPKEEIARYMDRVRTEDYEWVVPSFERYIRPDPDQFDPMIEALSKIAAMFGERARSTGEWRGASGGLARVNTAKVEMAQWAGDFRDSFIDSFLDPLELTLPNHGDLAGLAVTQLKGIKILYIRQRDSVLGLLDNAIKATQTLNNGATSRDDALKWATIALVVIGTLGGPFAATVGIAAGFACVEVVGTIGQGLLPEPTDERLVPLSAPTATEVATNVSQAMSRLNNDIYSGEQVAVGAFNELNRVVERQLYKAVSSNAGIGHFSVPVPELARSTPAEILAKLEPPA